MNMTKFFLILLTFLNSQISLADNNFKISQKLNTELQSSELVDLYLVLKSEKDIIIPKTKNRMQRLNDTIKLLKFNANKNRKEIETQVKGLTNDYQFYWINNSLRAKMTPQKALKLINNPKVLKAYSNKSQKLSIVTPDEIEKTDKANNQIEWGLEKIHVPEVWNLGVKGKGVIIAGQDTGYQWNHPALKEKYAGWNGKNVDHNYNWHDSIHTPNIPCLDSNNNPASCDDNGHGTHTMGTMLGDDNLGNQIGIAPDAKWIGCRNMNQGNGTPSSYTECFQFFLEPTDLNGLNPDSNKAPHIINNSWSCPPSEGCIDANALKSVVDNVTAAGILVVASAGNSGSSCNTVSSPISIYQQAFTVGSINSNGLISSFSSRGNVIVDGSNRVKPNVVAPGGGVRSADLNGTYSFKSGTSMAAPHVAGVAALMISANPSLAGNPELIKTIIEESSVPHTTSQNCNGVAGSERPNNTYGWGRVDALAAVNQATRFFGPSKSALWFNPDESGHGINVYMLADNNLIVIWYVYDSQGNPIWLLGIGSHDGIEATLDVKRYDGALFPPSFDSDDVIPTVWGQFKLSFSSCDAGNFKWIPVADNGFSAGETNVIRLNTTLGLSCITEAVDAKTKVDMTTSSSTIQAAHSALWFDPEQNGHGINVYLLSDDVLIVLWYIYNNTGDPIWLLGIGTHDGSKATLDVKYYDGAMFPPNFESDDVNPTDWGQFELEFSGCDTGLFKWMPVDNNGFTAGEMNLTRLTTTLGLTCTE